MSDREAVQQETVAEVASEPATAVAEIGAGPISAGLVRQPAGLARLDPESRVAAVGELQRVAGNSAVQRMLRPATPPGQTLVQRDMASELVEYAGYGQEQAEADARQNLNQPPAMRVSNVSDVASARRLVTEIEGYRGHMQEGAGAGGAFTVQPTRVTPAKMDANETAIAALNDYLVQAGEQGRTLSSFQQSLQRARTDYERIQAQVVHLTVAGRVSRDADAGQLGREVVQSSGFADPAAAQDRMQRLQQDPATLAVHNQVQQAHEQMVQLGQQAGSKQSAATQSVHSFTSALNSFKTGIPSIQTNPDQAKELSELKDEIEKVKKYVTKGLEYAGKGLEAAGVAGASKVTDNAAPVVEFLTDQFYDAKLNAINSKISQYNAAHREHAITANLENVRGAKTGFIRAMTEFTETVQNFSRAQTNFRDMLKAFGRAADTKAGRGDRFAQIAAMLGEVDVYVTQLDDALRMAYQEQAAAAEASASRRTLTGGPREGGGRDAGLEYYEPYRWFHANGGWGYECQKQEVRLNIPGSRGAAEGAANVGVNATVEQAVQDLQTFRRDADQMRQALAQAMNLRMGDAMPMPVGAPAPTARSANQGL